MKAISKTITGLIISIVMVCTYALPSVSATTAKKKITLDNIPSFTDNAYVEINNNIPSFKKSELTTKCFEEYSTLDELGRCGTAFANIGKDIMPTEERGAIGMIKPSGWHTIKYDCVEGKYLYNRCHLIGYQLAGENANEQNLITGTRYLNTVGMLPFENQVADYVNDTDNHVLYRVTPIFSGNNLLADGVQIEAYSVEDKGKGICFNVFCYNVQPGIKINYANGNSKEKTSNSAQSIQLNYSSANLTVGKKLALKATITPSTVSKETITWSSSNKKVATVTSSGKVTAKKAGSVTITAKTANGLKATCKIIVANPQTSTTASITITQTSGEKSNYVLNTNTKKFHTPSCSSVNSMKAKNKKTVCCTRDEVIEMGYEPCKRCNP